MGWRCVRLVALLLIAVGAGAGADAVDIERFVDETGTLLQWDSFRQQGLLWKDSNVVAFSPHTSYIVYNYNQRVEIDAIRFNPDGQLLLDTVAYRTLKKLFSASQSTTNSGITAIFIDAGHGGKDSGAAGVFSTSSGKQQKVHEKDVVLQIATRLGDKLKNSFPDKRIILSRSKDVFLSLQQRAKLANAVRVPPGKSILFISIHANASLNPEASGYEVWYLPPEYRRNDLVDAQTVGVRDNDLLSILNSIKDEEYTIESVLLAQGIMSGLDGTIGLLSKNRGVKQELWFVVRQAKMPSVLVEVGFVSNTQEAERLHQSAYLQKIVDGIYNGVDKFIHDFE